MLFKLKSMRTALMLAFLLFTGSMVAQTVKVNVKDSSGEPVIGASVMEKGTRNGGITDLDGNFTIKLSGKNAITVSYIGMKTKTVDPKGKAAVDIVLEDDNTMLQEVVKIGYGSVRKKDITGSVATVNSDVLAAVPVASASEALTGKLAGVQVTTTEGSPDADVIIRVRGGGSVTQSNDPLYIVDGFPVDGISDIPASDIEDITVLKDASSTAIYGSRGANGVILVTTKSGKEGKVKVSYNAYYSWKTNAKKMDLLSTTDYLKWQYEYIMLTKNGDPSKYEETFGKYQDIDLYADQPTNDWQDLMFGRTGHTFNHNISITGGSKEIKYAFGYAHMNDKAIMRGSSFKRDNFSLKLNTKPTKNTTLDFNIRYSDTDINGGGTNVATSSSSSTDKRLRNAVLYSPIPLQGLVLGNTYDEDASFGSVRHPIKSNDDNDRTQERKNLNMAGAFGWELFKNFKVKTEWGYDHYTSYDARFYGLTTYYVQNDSKLKNQPALKLVATDRHRVRNTNTVSYDFKKLFPKNSKHTLNALAGHEYVITKKRTNTDMIEGFPTSFDFDKAKRLTVQGTPRTVEDYYSPDDKLLSFFGRANYDYDSKYLVSVTFRADASSKFNKENRWGYFPSAAIAWRISSEPFMKWSESWLDDLKLRFSYGTAGNNAIDPGYLRQDITSKELNYVNGYSSYLGLSTRMANPDLKWETTVTRNIGLDITLWDGKVRGSFEAYINTTKDLLIDYRISSGNFTSQYRNLGETENKGFEASLTYNIVNKKDWGISVNGNISFNNSKIKSLGAGFNPYTTTGVLGSTEIPNDYVLQVGSAVGLIYGYVNDGRYEVSDFTGYNATTQEWELKPGVADGKTFKGSAVRPGDMKIKDTNGDGQITSEDCQVIGNTNPDFIGGFGINARAYGFDLSANFNFSVGNDVYNANKIEYTSFNRNSFMNNLIDDMASGKRWTNIDANGNLVNDPEQLAAMNANTTMWSPYVSTNYRLTDWAIEKGSFLRLNTLTLGYTLPDKIVKKAGIQSLRFYATAYNVFCITDYSGYDPEVSTMRSTGLTPGVDYSAYPKSRQYVFGLNLNF